MDKKQRVVLTYGTFDLLHYGHMQLLKRAKAQGDYLIVALSSDEFNELKGKKSVENYKTRKEKLENVEYVDKIIPENCWEQKRDDVINNNVDVVVMGNDWEGAEPFENLKDICEVIYLKRTKGISTTQLKQKLGIISKNKKQDDDMER